MLDTAILPSDGLKKLRRIQVQIARLSSEALSLYEPLEHIKKFHASTAPDKLLRGSNRAGKTLGACAEVARACCGSDPHDKYPKRDGRCFIVGLDEKHNGEVLYRKLRRPGAFWVIQDEKTSLWRSWKPWDKRDIARKNEAKHAPPLIPDRLIKDESWTSKKEMCPSMVRLTNGWEMRFFSSNGIPPNGNDVDLVYFDEEITNTLWYGEVAARGLVERNGKFIWSATANKGGIQFYDLCKTAEKEKFDGVKNPRIVEFLAHLNVNPHITKDMYDLFFAKLTPEERRVRIDMEFEFTARKVYLEYTEQTHGIDYFVIPRDWTRYMVVDPGRQVCAVLFAAIPPPKHELGGHVILYDELYIRNCDTEKFAQAVREKTQGQAFRDFLIDHQGARVRQMDQGGNQEEQLSRALKKAKVRSQLSKHGFTWGSSDVDAGLSAVKSWMIDQCPDKRPKLLVMAGKLEYWKWEIDRYHYKKETKARIVTDKPEQRHNHLMDCLRYLAMYDPQWHKPVRRMQNRVTKIMRNKRKKLLEKDGAAGINLGPTS